jgi:hypothetical protein
MLNAANQNLKAEGSTFVLTWFSPEGPNPQKGKDPNNQDVRGLSFDDFDKAVAYAQTHPTVAMASTFSLYEIEGQGKAAKMINVWEIDDLGTVERVA